MTHRLLADYGFVIAPFGNSWKIAAHEITEERRDAFSSAENDEA